MNTLSILIYLKGGRQAGGLITVSHTPFVGSHVPHLQLDTGIWVTQGCSPVSCSRVIETALARELEPQSCLERAREVCEESLWERSQIAIITPSGATGAHNGSLLDSWAQCRIGLRYVIVGNRLTGERVLLDAEETMRKTEGSALEERLFLAASAGVAAGGDRLGHQSCALIVHKEGQGLFGVGDVFMDIRVEDREDPLPELWRLIVSRRALLADMQQFPGNGRR